MNERTSEVLAAELVANAPKRESVILGIGDCGIQAGEVAIIGEMWHECVGPEGKVLVDSRQVVDELVLRWNAHGALVEALRHVHGHHAIPADSPLGVEIAEALAKVAPACPVCGHYPCAREPDCTTRAHSRRDPETGWPLGFGPRSEADKAKRGASC